MAKYNIHIPDIPVFVPDSLDRLMISLLLRYRKRHYGFAFRKIKLSQGKYAIVDPEDYEKLIGYVWYAANALCTFYAQRNENGKSVRMHRQIMNPPAGLFVDHQNHNGLDNRKANLQIVTPAENTYNKRKERGLVSSKYKGVSFRKRLNKWTAYISYRGRRINLGCFDDEIDAAKAYDEAAKELFGRFASLNFEKDSH